VERRSRLGPEREAEIFGTVLDLVRKHGYERVTMQQIASESRSSTATLYRRWAGKPRLVAESLRHHAPPPLADIDTGSLRGDFIEGIRRMTTLAGEDQELMSALANASRTDPELAEAMQEILARPMADAAHRILDRATVRSEITADAPGREFVGELLLSITLARRIASGRPVDEEYMTRFVDAVILPTLGVTGHDR
jgi:AcrR family transcriptional regulator